MISSGFSSNSTKADNAADFSSPNLTLVNLVCAHETSILQVVIEESLGVIVSLAKNGDVVLLDLDRGKFLRGFQLPLGLECKTLAISSLGHIVIATESKLLVYSLDGIPLACVEDVPPFQHLAIHADGSHMVCAGSSALSIYSIPQLTLLHTESVESPVTNLSFVKLSVNICFVSITHANGLLEFKLIE